MDVDYSLPRDRVLQINLSNLEQGLSSSRFEKQDSLTDMGYSLWKHESGATARVPDQNTSGTYDMVVEAIEAQAFVTGTHPFVVLMEHTREAAYEKQHPPTEKEDPSGRLIPVDEQLWNATKRVASNLRYILERKEYRLGEQEGWLIAKEGATNRSLEALFKLAREKGVDL